MDESSVENSLRSFYAALRQLLARQSSSRKAEFNLRRYKSLSAGGRKHLRFTIGFSCWIRVHLPARKIFTSSLPALNPKTESCLLATAVNTRPLKQERHSNNFKSTEWRPSNLVRSSDSANPNS